MLSFIGATRRCIESYVGRPQSTSAVVRQVKCVRARASSHARAKFRGDVSPAPQSISQKLETTHSLMSKVFYGSPWYLRDAILP